MFSSKSDSSRLSTLIWQSAMSAWSLMSRRANNRSLIRKEHSNRRVISARQLNNLPINRRNFLDFALLTPGVSDADNVNDSTDFRVAQTPQSGLSFGGNNGRGNSINVDGSTADTAVGRRAKCRQSGSRAGISS